MKLKNIIGSLVALGAMALMAVGVQAATYSVGALTTDGIGEVDGTNQSTVSVPVVVTPSETDTTGVDVNGYAMTFTYDPTVVEAVSKTDNGETYYATAGESFNADNTVIVSDVKDVTVDGASMKQVIVAWASAEPVNVTEASAMASVDFNILDKNAKEANIDVAVIQLANDGENLADESTYIVANGVIDINNETLLLGDVDGSGGYPDLIDSNLLRRYVDGLIELTSEQLFRGNVDGEGETPDMIDSNTLRRYVDGLVSYEEMIKNSN